MKRTSSVMYTFSENESHYSTPSVWCSVLTNEVNVSDGFHSLIGQFGAQTFLSHRHLQPDGSAALNVVPSNRDSPVSPRLLLSTFKINHLFTWSLCFHYLRGKTVFPFWKKKPVVKLLSKCATGLYSMPWLLQHTPISLAISCWCSAFFHIGWIGHMVYKDGWYVKLY